MKTEQEIKQDIFDYLKPSEAISLISGRLFKESLRPMSSKAEDVVLSILSSDMSSEYQRAIVLVNVYVGDLRRDDGEAIENCDRLRLLSGVFARVLDRFAGDGYRCTLERQQVLEVDGRGEHCISHRLLYQHLHERG